MIILRNNLKNRFTAEEDRVNEGRAQLPLAPTMTTRGRHNYLGHTNIDKLMSHLGHQPTTPPHSERELHGHQLRHYKNQPRNQKS